MSLLENANISANIKLNKGKKTIYIIVIYIYIHDTYKVYIKLKPVLGSVRRRRVTVNPRIRRTEGIDEIEKDDDDDDDDDDDGQKLGHRRKLNAAIPVMAFLWIEERKIYLLQKFFSAEKEKAHRGLNPLASKTLNPRPR